MLPVETLLELIARVEKAMRPLSATQYDQDHERVRELYTQMLAEDTDDPLEQARQTVLLEILQPYLTSLFHTELQETHAVNYHVKAAIGALVVLLCRLDERDFSAASISLATACEALQEVQELLKSLKGNVVHA